MKLIAFLLKLPTIILVTLSLLVVIFLLSAKNCERIDCLTFENSSHYKLDKEYENSKHIFRGLYKYDNTFVRSEIRSDLSANDAKEAVRVQITRTKGLFEDTTAPYPGEISDVIGCNNIYKPSYRSAISKTGVKIDYFEGYLNDRFVLGSCSDDQAVYHVVFTMLYCNKQNKFYQLEYITPSQKYKKGLSSTVDFLNSIACRQ